MWKAFLTTPSVHELADFAILLLGMSVNQAGLERNFSDLKIKKTRLRMFKAIEKMAKVGGMVQTFVPRKWKPDISISVAKDEANVTELLTVLRYAALLEEEAHTCDKVEGLSKTRSGPVNSRDGWQREMAKWIEEERAHSASDDEELGNAMYGRQRSKWLPRSLDKIWWRWDQEVRYHDYDMLKGWKQSVLSNMSSPGLKVGDAW